MHLIYTCVPTNKILDYSNLKAFAVDNLKLNVVQVLDVVEKTVGKGDNSGYKHCLLPQCFQRPSC